jgi:hypothetical protein
MTEPIKSETNGAFLLSLDSELKQNRLSVRHSILVEALFSRRVCLNDTYIIDNEALQDFFLTNKQDLLDEVGDAAADRPPMLGGCSRKGANIFEVLDVMLAPKEPTGLPTYFTRLGRRGNDDLRRRVNRLRSAGARRSAFFKQTSPEAERSLEVICQYLSSCAPALVRSEEPRNLFETIKEKLDDLERPQNRRRLRRIDLEICGKLRKEIDVRPQSPSRERLHLAIYEGNLPHYLPEKKQFEDLGHDYAGERLEWRYLINTYYNFNLSEKYGSCPTLNQDWFRIPKRLVPAADMRQHGNLEKIREIRLEGKIYPELLTVPFVASVRRTGEFWDGIGRMEDALNGGDADAYARSFDEHLKFIVSCCAKHLEDSGKGHLLKANISELWLGQASKVAFPLFCAEAVYRLLHGLPHESFTLHAWHVVELTATGLFAWLPIKVKSPEFKRLGSDLRKFARPAMLLS